MNDVFETSKILLVDDDQELGRMLQDYLSAENLQLKVCGTGESGLAELRLEKFALVILDIMLPGIDGLQVLRALRRIDDVPVIMLTARGDDVDRIIGLEFGADDYLAKPFNPRELVARIKAILRRAQTAAKNKKTWSLGAISLDPATRSVSVAGDPLPLTGTEFELLHCLLQTPGDVVSRERLSESALGRRLLPYDRSIDTHISNLRKKLERTGSSDGIIQNQRGIGYVLLPANLSSEPQ
jgi:two-component system response regulator CpxR